MRAAPPRTLSELSVMSCHGSLCSWWDVDCWENRLDRVTCLFSLFSLLNYKEIYRRLIFDRFVSPLQDGRSLSNLSGALKVNSETRSSDWGWRQSLTPCKEKKTSIFLNCSLNVLWLNYWWHNSKNKPLLHLTESLLFQQANGTDCFHSEDAGKQKRFITKLNQQCCFFSVQWDQSNL